ncbi:DUF6954 family protein [Cohnella sp. GCM10027633]|uniref:DUF6954 family protein n=1 Tax=unclassified Cohnella TaxID=2636738 RepID=UPI00363688B2
MGKWLVNTVFGAIYVAIAVFGVGPVLFADGSWTERLWTAIVVIVILIIAIVVHFALLRPKYRM